jgi:hypothetical protein
MHSGELVFLRVDPTKTEDMIKHSEGFKKVSFNASNRSVRALRPWLKISLQGREMLVEPGLSVYIARRNDIRILWSGFHFPDYLFSHSEVVNSYEVPDLSRLWSN